MEIILSTRPKYQRCQAHEQAGNAERISIRVFVSDLRDGQKGERGAKINTPVKQRIRSLDSPGTGGFELVTHKGRDTRLDSAAADGQKGQPDVEHGEFGIDGMGKVAQGHDSVSKTIEKGDVEDRSITSQPAVRNPGTQQRSEIDSGFEQVGYFVTGGLPPSEMFGYVQGEDGNDAVVAKPLAGLVADNEERLLRHLLFRRCLGRWVGSHSKGSIANR